MNVHVSSLSSLRMEELKTKVRRRLNNANHPSELLNYVDTLHRLGIAYHFVSEIESKLKSFLKDIATAQENGIGRQDETDQTPQHDLYTVALQFRLLRQHGLHASEGKFQMYSTASRTPRGRFHPELAVDTKGLLSLYEASQFALPTERTLDEAKAFAGNQLKSSLHKGRVLQNDRLEICEAIKHGLEHPLHATVPRIGARHYIECLRKENHEYLGDGDLRELAALDFNHLQSMHQTELQEFIRWWGELGISGEEFGWVIRNEPGLWFMLSALALPEPEFSECRIQLSKVTALVFVLDDMFDVYGAYNDLLAFTHAINRWDFAYVGKLPNYMKSCYLALLTLSNDVARQVLEQHGCNIIQHLRSLWSSLLDAFWKEWRWLRAKEVPFTNEYLENATITSGLPVFLTHAFFLMGHAPNQQMLNIQNAVPQIILLPALIFRLWDDLGTSKEEKERGYDASYVECYMKHHAAAEEIAREAVERLIGEAWKKLNQLACCYPDHQRPNSFSTSFIRLALNSARVGQLLCQSDHQHDDGQRGVIMKDHLKKCFSRAFIMSKLHSIMCSKPLNYWILS